METKGEEKKMRKLRNLALILGSALVLGSGAQAATITHTLDFEGITGNFSQVLTNYGGFTWENTGILDGTRYNQLGLGGAAPLFFTDSGYDNATGSVGPNAQHNYVAYNLYALTASAAGSAFNLASADFTAAWYDGLILTVTGYTGGIGGTVVKTQDFVLNPINPLHVDFSGFTGIDSLTFATSGGTPHTAFLRPDLDDSTAAVGIGLTGPQFVMDNLIYTTETPDIPAPEPSSMILGAMGIGSLLKLRKRVAA